MTDWKDWKKRNRRLIAHPAGFEEMFVDEILAKISIISPADVRPQAHFIDNKGCNRYIDFLIFSPERGWNLPIELDGYSKIVDGGHSKWNDFLERQNALLGKFGALLRYSNKQMLETPGEVRSEIIKTLEFQSCSFALSQKQRSEREILKAGYEKSARELSQNSIAQRQLENDISVIRTHLATLTPEVAARPQEVAAKVNKGLSFSAAATMAAVVVIGSVVIATRSEVSGNRQDLQVLVPTADARTTLGNSVSQVRRLPAAEALNHVGEIGFEFCGVVASVSEFSRGIYVNFDRAYPNQTLTGVVWSEHSSQISGLALVGSNWCVAGVVKEFKGRPQVEIRSKSQLRIFDGGVS